METTSISVNKYEWSDAFWESDLTSTHKLVCAALAKFMDETGFCYPGQNKLAQRASLSSRCVRDKTKELDERGWIRRCKVASMSGPFRYEYTARVPPASECREMDAEPEAHSGHSNEQEERSGATRKVVPIDAASRSVEHSNEVPIECSRTTTSSNGPATEAECRVISLATRLPIANRLQSEAAHTDPATTEIAERILVGLERLQSPVSVKIVEDFLAGLDSDTQLLQLFVEHECEEKGKIRRANGLRPLLDFMKEDYPEWKERWAPLVRESRRSSPDSKTASERPYGVLCPCVEFVDGMATAAGSLGDVWPEAASRLSERMDAKNFAAYIEPLAYSHSYGDEIAFYTRDEFHFRWVESRYLGAIANTVAEITGTRTKAQLKNPTTEALTARWSASPPTAQSA